MRELSGPSFNEGTNPIREGSTLITQSPPKGPLPNTITLGIRVQHMNLGHIQSMAGARGPFAPLPDLSLPTWGAFLFEVPKPDTSKERSLAPLLTPPVSGLDTLSTHFSGKKFESGYLEMAQMCEKTTERLEQRKYKPFFYLLLRKQILGH